MDEGSKSEERAPASKRYVRAVGPKLRRLLFVVFGLFALLGANALYLLGIRVLGLTTGQSYESFFYLCMFLLHLVLGALIVVPVIVFGLVHMRNAHDRKNRRAVRVGYALFIVSLVLLASGLVLTRIEGLIDVRDATVRGIAYGAHVATPVLAAWLFILHRLAGPRIRWRVGGYWLAAAGGFAAIMVLFAVQDPRSWNVVGNPSGDKYFFPSLARTVSGDFIPADTLMMDDYCQGCHEDIHRSWAHSMHRFSSFNNPAYEFSVKQTRKSMFERDGHVRGSRFCAGCHDPVPFFSGAFDDPRFDDPDYDLSSDSLAQAGITCTSCHAITNINSNRGNSDFTIEEPIHYPFAFSENSLLQAVNHQLVKAKPGFHKKTFLKPLHQSAEFCGTCHKVHLPVELNDYKWLRGQNHYDSYLLSGVSGSGVQSFYYPPKAQPSCNGCHMPLRESDDFGAKVRDDGGKATVHEHQFPSANTAIPHLLGMPEWVNDAQREFLTDTVRVDLFGLRRAPDDVGGGESEITWPLTAPLRPEVPQLEPGRSYLLELVVRTMKLGHLFTQGTADSNEVWVDLEVTSGGATIGRSGGLGRDGEVDPWSHFVNAWVVDRDGNRIDRRNAEDIFTALYNNQIPPGAADVVQYRLTVPESVTGPVTVRAALKFRKFDTTYMRHFQGESFAGNDLPITTICSDEVTFPVRGSEELPAPATVAIPEWQRWNDYGIGLLRKSDRGELRQAAAAFTRVEELGRADGPVNLARVYLREGLIQTHAPEALARAATLEPAAPAWTLLWLGAEVDKANGRHEEAVARMRQIVDGGFEQARGRGFDFSRDYRLLNAIGQSTYLLALQERGPQRADERRRKLTEASEWYERALALDVENAPAHWGLKQVYGELGDDGKAAEHAALHDRYRPDDNARDRAIAAARRSSAAANHAAEAVVLYDLQRPQAFGLELGQGSE